MKRSQTLVEQRRQEMLVILRERGTVPVSHLAEELGVSALTARRDLDSLEERGLIQRHYGKATYLPTPSEAGVTQREIFSAAIARKAARLVKDGDVIFINTSHTALKIPEYIESRDVSIISNSCKIHNVTPPPSATILTTGGEVRVPKGIMFGEYALASLRKFSPSICFLGCAGISSAGCVMSNSVQEATINALVVERSVRKVVVASSSKLHARTGFSYARPEQIDTLVTDVDISQGDSEALLRVGFGSIITADPEKTWGTARIQL